MFAPKVVKAQTNDLDGQTNKLVTRRSKLIERPLGGAADRARILQRSIGNQAMLRLPSQKASSQTGKEVGNDCEPEVAPENTKALKTALGVSWDFSKIPIGSPDRPNQPQALFPFPAPPPLGAIQAKLAVGQVDDPLEHEADRVADQVMSTPDRVQRACCSGCALGGSCEGELATPVAGALYDSGHFDLKSPGRPLDSATRSFMEPRFGHDFSRVRVHDDAHAAESARTLNALAYTVGNDVVFDAHQYRPGSHDGRRLLAHELTHVVQQGKGSQGFGGGPMIIQRQPKQPTPPCPPSSTPVRQLPSDFNTPQNVQALAEILWHEMGNKVPESIAVGSIVLNRLLKTKFHKVAQLFSFERKPDPPANVVALACGLLIGQYDDSTNGSENYFSPQSMPDAANAGCCTGQSGPCNIPKSTGKLDCKGGLQTVPGTTPPQQRYSPVWAAPGKRQPQPSGTDPMLIQVYTP